MLSASLNGLLGSSFAILAKAVLLPFSLIPSNPCGTEESTGLASCGGLA